MKRQILILTLLTLLTPYTVHSQWFQQSLPVSGTINDMAFLNKDTGFVAMDNSNFLRTTNGGDNWTVISSFRIYVMNKIDSVTAYGMTVDGSKIYRTFNGGTVWDSVSPVSPMCWISFIGKDTGWISTLGGIFKTTNGGISANFISNQAPVNCGKLYMLKQNYSGQNYGFFIDNAAFLWKTSNSGFNWNGITGLDGVHDLFFLNRDTGWVVDNPMIGNIYKILYTHDGLTTFDTQYVATIGSYAASKIYAINAHKVWAGNGYWNIIHASTNGGINWGTQSISFLEPEIVKIVDTTVGWAGLFNLAKTTNGGGIITYSGIDSNKNNIPVSFELRQNYPNPFNPQTTIGFSLSKNANVSLIIYDILGKEIVKVYNDKFLAAGNYKTILDLSKINLSSGLYFYVMKVSDNQNKQIFSDTKKMLYIK
jgi:photosystem II stability/assembly factor-like uncharacterized protein